MIGLGQSVLAERSRFQSILAAAPHEPGRPQYVEMGENASIQGQEDGFFVNVGGVQVLYESKCLEAGDPVVERTILLSDSDHSDESLWKLETSHRDTVVRERDEAVLGDQSLQSTAVYPGTGGARQGVIVREEPLGQLPLSADQDSQLSHWQIAH